MTMQILHNKHGEETQYYTHTLSFKRFFKEINNCIQQGCTKSTKGHSIRLQKIYISKINAVLFNFVFISESWKKQWQFTWKYEAVFNMFLSTNSAFHCDFRSYV